MATTVIISIGSRTSDSVTVSTVTTTTVSGYANAWSVVLSATVPSTTKIGDKLTTGALDYLITNISGSTLTVVGDPFTTTTAPSTGSGATTRAFPSISTWVAGAPANLTTQDSGNGWVWKGELYKEGAGTNGEWSITTTVSYGATCNASSYYLLEAAAGQSFKDNAGKLTNALRYNTANGVAVSVSGNYTWGFNTASPGICYVRGLQINLTWRPASVGTGPLTFDQCIIKSAGVYAALGDVTSAINCVIYVGGTSNSASGAGSGTIQFLNCTIAGGAANAFTFGSFVTATVKNCAIFGFTSAIASNPARISSAASTYNATDLASFGWTATGNIVSKTFANQFENITGGSEDFRVKAGADLINAGTRDQTYTSDLDIVGSARSTTTPTIGAWEFPSITYTYARPASDITTQWTPSTGTDHFALIDETTANDADYIYATAAGQTDEVKLAAMTAPQAGTDLLINYKVAGIVGSASVTMSLRQGSGGTLIATDTAKTSDNTYQLVVPAATWASVTDWTDLRLRFVSA